MSTTVVIRQPEEGEAHWVLGDRYTFKVTGAETAGRFLLVEAELFGGAGPPLHRHSREDELFYVLEGSLEVTADGVTRELGPGALAYLPRGSRHTFRAHGDRARALVLAAGAGIEDFFRQIGTPARRGDQTPPPVNDRAVADVLRLAPRYGLSIEGPP